MDVMVRIPWPWTPWMGRRFIDGRLWFLMKKKNLHCTDDVHWEASVWISTLTLPFHANLFDFYSYYIVTRGYIYTPCMLCTYSYSFIKLYYKFTYLKTSRLPQELEPASFCSPAGRTIHYTIRPRSSLWYFWLYSSIFINFDFQVIIKYFSIVQF